jgi:hypothetical protein
LACASAACEPAQGTDEDDDGGSAGSGGPASDGCEASPGNYQATYSPVSDNCGGVGALPSERYSVNSDGEILTIGGTPIGNGSAPSGCVDDDVSIDGCVLSFTRACASVSLLFGSAAVEGDFTLDFATGSGSVDIRIGVYDGLNLLQSCEGEQRISIRR